MTRDIAVSDQSKVLLVDDHPIVRQGLRQLINVEPDLVVCGEASGVAEAIALAERTSPDIAVVDIALEDRSGVELIKDFRNRHPDMRSLALSMYDESLYAVRVLRAGGRGYLMKQEVTKKIVPAIRRVLDGHIYVSDAMATRLVGKMSLRKDVEASPFAELSDREVEVLMLIGQGLTTREIAERLLISVKTVEAHKERMKDKLKVSSGTELLRFAVRYTLDNDPADAPVAPVE